jgi:hypothetical protein
MKAGIPFREYMRECTKKGMCDILYKNHPILEAIFWCKKYDTQCKSSVCRDERGVKVDK